MSQQQDFLERAALELGLRFELDKVVALSGGDSVTSWIYFPDLSSSSGIYVIPWSKSWADIESRLPKHLTASFVPEAGAEVFDIDNYSEMFAEWGWSGSDTPPAWMQDIYS